MRALSLTQPWPWIILNLDKDVENRVWSTKHRGPFLLHAAKGAPKRTWHAARDFVAERFDSTLASEIPPWGDPSLPRGGIVGIATIYAVASPCVDPTGWLRDVGPCERRWHMHEQYGFLLRDVRPLPFLAVPGRQRWFNIDHPSLPRPNETACPANCGGSAG